MDWLADLTKLFSKAVERACEDKVGVIFSAGVDSALVAYVCSDYSDVTAYNVGVAGSLDTEHARRLESEAPFDVKYVELTSEDVEALVPEVLSCWGNVNPLTVGVGIPFYCASKAASADGLDVLLCGQGGDELFGGYWRYLEAMVSKGPDAVSQWMEKDCANAYEDNLNRDIAMNKKNSTQLRFPFLDDAFADYVRKMPLELKIREDADDIVCDEVGGRRFARKYALKKLAFNMGVPEYIVNRLKKAAQYGSATHKTLDKIARARGYKKKAADAGRKDYLQMYLEDINSQL